MLYCSLTEGMCPKKIFLLPTSFFQYLRLYMCYNQPFQDANLFRYLCNILLLIFITKNSVMTIKSRRLLNKLHCQSKQLKIAMLNLQWSVGVAVFYSIIGFAVAALAKELLLTMISAVFHTGRKLPPYSNWRMDSKCWTVNR